MARTVRNAKIDSRSARARLAQRAEPYWTVISEGCALGYRRGSKGGTWVARFRDDSGKQHYEALGGADDARDPDNLTAFRSPRRSRKLAISSPARSGRSPATSFRRMVHSP